MNPKQKKHKRIILQRILTIILTVLFLSALTAGIIIAAGYLKPILSAEWEKMKKPLAPASANEAPTEEPEDDGWIINKKEELEVDYADIPEPDPEAAAQSEEPEYDPKVEAVLSGMSLEQKAAQLFILTPEALTGAETVTEAGDASKEALLQNPVGGIIYFSKNIEDPEQLSEMLRNMQLYAQEIEGFPLFLCVDEEGGRVSRIASNEAFELTNMPPMEEVGNTGDIDSAYNAGFAIGMYLHDYGFNVDLAPVADLKASTSENGIGDRSFGESPELVSKMTWQFAEGLRSQGVLPCFKHFPGLKGTVTDTHTGAAVLDQDLDELKESDLVPFENAIISGAHMIMASHASCPKITGDNTPASLSPKMLTDILRGELGFSGLIITDSLSMGAITESYSPGEAAKLAVMAGADLLLMPSDYAEAYAALVDAVRSGEISEERLDESLRRILQVKIN